MKRLVLVAVLLSLPAIADECINDFIHFRLQPDDYECRLDVDPFITYELQLIASFYKHSDPVNRLEFKVMNPLLDPYYPDGMVEWDWGGHSVTGDFATGLIIEFNPPMDVGTSELLLATITFISFQNSWPQDDHVMNVEDPVVYDIYGQGFYTSRGFFHFNPIEPYTFCFLGGDYEIVDAHVESVSPPPGAVVVGNFDLDYTVASWWCMPGEPWPFDGEVRLNGELIHEFEGFGVEDFSLPVDVSSYPEGEEIIVGIWVHGCDEGYADDLPPIM